MLRFGTVKVDGASMLPTYSSGDWLAVLWGARPKVGSVVVAARATGTLVIKRAVRRESEGWWLEGDNPEASSDSRSLGPFGPEQIKGRVLFRYRRGAGSRRVFHR